MRLVLGFSNNLEKSQLLDMTHEVSGQVTTSYASDYPEKIGQITGQNSLPLTSMIVTSKDGSSISGT